jgi:outer membrane protein OmpA-like peptidoglycan-associated protein
MKKVLLGLLIILAAGHTYAAPFTTYEEADSARPKKVKVAKEARKKDSPKPPADTTTTRSSSSSANNSTSKYQLPYRTWALAVNGSFTNPYTDIKYRRFLGVSKPKNEYQWGVGLSGIHMLDGAFGIMGTFNAGALQGVADSNMDDRITWNAMRAAGLDPSGEYFKANFYEGSLSLYWDISNTVFGINRLLRGQNSGKGYKPRFVSLYMFAGVGFNYTNTKVYHLNSGLLDTRTDSTGHPIFNNAATSDLVLPVGVGVKFKLSKLIDLGIENSWHFTFTDELDGFEYTHINNKRRDDFYSMTGVTLTFKLGTRKRDKEHIEWRNPIENVYARLDRLDKRVDNLYRDDDGDGVSNVFDKDPNTPEGVKVYGDGTSVDSDHDGVPDYRDVEPFSDPGAKVDADGKSIDSDGDGVPDSRDLEPNTPKGNMVNFQGISLDKHYVNKDSADKILGNGRGGFFFPAIYFEFNQANIDRQYESNLQSIAKTIRENQGLVLKVIGYCDQRGTIPYNDDLGMRRAKTVIDYMVRVYGFSPSSFEAVSVGNRVTEKAENWINRRVDFSAKQ